MPARTLEEAIQNIIAGQTLNEPRIGQETGDIQSPNEFPFEFFPDIETRLTNLLGIQAENLGLNSAINSLEQNLRAQQDPTIPALLNTQLARFAQGTNEGNIDVNAILSGLAPSTGLPGGAQATVGGDPSNPFNIPLQQTREPNPNDQTFIDLLRGGRNSVQSLLAEGLSRFSGEPLFVPNQPAPVQAAIAPPPQEAAVAPQQAAPAPQPNLSPPNVLDSFATGTDFVPQTGPFQLHQGEAVIPANQNPANPAANVQPVTGGFPQPDSLANLQQGAPAIPQANTFDPAMQIAMQQQPPPAIPLAQPPVQQQPAPNFLNQSLQALSGLTTSGGPITPELQAQQQQQVRDTSSQFLTQNLQGIREDFGGRGLGLSGLQANQELQARLGSQNAVTNADNQIALQAAQQNFGGLSSVAQALGQGSLGAGQFGLEVAQTNENIQRNRFLDILKALNQSFANPETVAGAGAGTTVNIGAAI